MRKILIIAFALGLGPGLWPDTATASVLDGSVPMLCVLTAVMECSTRGECERRTAQDAHVPPFIRVNVPQLVLTSIDGRRTSPIATIQRADGRLMLQGAQNGRVWGAVIDQTTGQMSASVTEHDGAFVLTGACVVP